MLIRAFGDIPMKVLIIKGKNIILRPMSLRDAPKFCEWLGDKEVTQFLNLHDSNPPTIKEEREYILEQKRKNDTAQFAIATEGKLIGTVSLMKIHPVHKHAEYGIFIGDREYWHQGIGTQAGKMILEYGFRVLRLNKIYLRHVAYNIAGAKSYKKLGFKKEGVQRQHIRRNGHWHDEPIMSILKDEFTSRNMKHKT